MANNLPLHLVPECVGDIPILLLDHDATSAAFLTSVLEQFSCRVMSVNVASKAPSVTEEHKDIKLVIANIEMPDIDSHCFLNALLGKDIPLILICPEIKTKQISNFWTKRACFCLQKPLSEKDIKNMWQHVSHNKSQTLEKNNVAGKQEYMEQIKAFRQSLKRQRASQLSLLGKRPIMKKLKNSETYQKRRCIANADWETKLEIERRRSLWTEERHMKFLNAINILNEENPSPQSILKIMNDPNLTKRQVHTYLEEYKAKVERLSSLPMNEWRSTNKTFYYPSNYEYPFKASNLRENLIRCNSLWLPLSKNNSPSSSSSNSQSSVNKPVEERNREKPKFYLGGVLDLDKCVLPPLSNNPPYNVSPANDDNHNGLVSAGLNGNNLPVLSRLPSSGRASNTNAFQMGSIPQSNPSPFQSPSSVLETNRNQIGLDPTSRLDAYVLPDYTMNHFEATMNQMGWFSSTESYGPSQNMISSTTLEGFLHYETSSAVQYSVIPSETNINHMGMTSSGERHVVTQVIVSVTNTTHMGLVTHEISHRISSETNTTILETNINQTGWVYFEENYVRLENIISSTANTTQVDLFPSAMDTLVHPGTNVEDTSLVLADYGYDGLIENLISFDTNINEMNMQSCLNFAAFNTPIGSTPHITTEAQDRCFSMPFGSTRQQETTVEDQGEGLYGGDNLEDDPDLLDWIDQFLNGDA